MMKIPFAYKETPVSDYMQYAWEAFAEGCELVEAGQESKAMEQLSFSAMYGLRALLWTIGRDLGCSGNIEEWYDLYLDYQPDDYFGDMDFPISEDVAAYRQELELFLHKAQKYFNACFQVERFE